MADYMLVLVLQKILSLSGLIGQNILLLCHHAEWKRIMDDRRAIFVFLLCSVSSSTVCLYTACKLYAHAPSLLLHFGWISSATHSPGIWSKECFPMMPRKMGGKDSFGRCGRGLSLCCHSFVYNPPSGGKKKDQREEKCSYQGNCNLQSFLFMWTDMVRCSLFIMLLQRNNKAKGFDTAEEEMKKVVVQQGWGHRELHPRELWDGLLKRLPLSSTFKAPLMRYNGVLLCELDL